MQDIIKNTIQRHQTMVTELLREHLETIEKAAQLLIDTFKNDHRVYICGNGGSAADAQHIAGELVGRFLKERRALPAIALTTDTSLLTAIGNDYGYDQLFARQVEGLVNEGDILWCYSTSGTSTNIINAVNQARKQGAKVLSFTGRSNTPLEELSDICLPAPDTTSARSQEIHELVYHILCDLIEKGLFGETA